MSEAFGYVERDGVLAGPVRSPRNSARHLGAGSIHDDATAQKLGFRGGTVADLAERVLEIASSGLKARRRIDDMGNDESHFLSALREIVARGTSPAEVKLDAYHGRWGGDLSHLFDEYAY